MLVSISLGGAPLKPLIHLHKDVSILGHEIDEVSMKISLKCRAYFHRSRKVVFKDSDLLQGFNGFPPVLDTLLLCVELVNIFLLCPKLTLWGPIITIFSSSQGSVLVELVVLTSKMLPLKASP